MNRSIDKMEEECGVFGIFSREKKDGIAYLTSIALHALQHRGQESAGITVSNFGDIKTYKEMGLVGDVFTSEVLEALTGNSAIGHVRYSTQGGSLLENAQPLESSYRSGSIAVAHNGNITNAGKLRSDLIKRGGNFSTTSDSEVILRILTLDKGKNIVESLRDMTETLEGSYALVILAENKLIGMRDPAGIRPLCMGQNSQGEWFLASESCALDSVGASLVKDIEPGEIVVVREKGVRSIKYDLSHSSPCSFEHIYFARPDSIIDGVDVYSARVEGGRLLAKQKEVEADIVIGVPDSGIPSAIGFSEASGIPYGIGLVRNSYSGRSFIEPSQEVRKDVVGRKLSPIRGSISGKRVVVVDDSLVRGTTSRKLIELLRKAGAREVHFRLASPPVKHPCFLGMDISSEEELLASKMSIEEMAEEIGADTLDFLSLENLYHALGRKGGCTGCFNGAYPVTSFPSLHKLVSAS